MNLNVRERKINSLNVPIPPGLSDLEVTSITDDSRKVQQGGLFLACPGAEQDGRAFIADAIERGARVIFLEADELTDSFIRKLSDSQTPFVPVKALKMQLGAIAAAYFGFPAKKLAVSAVTGTNGKTTCASLLAQIQARAGTQSVVIGTNGCGFVGRSNWELTGLTTPGAIQLQALFSKYLSEGAEAVCLEASSHSLDQFRLDAANIQLAIYTNLTRDHLDYHGDESTYKAAKMRLFGMPTLQTAIVNIDCPHGLSFCEYVRERNQHHENKPVKLISVARQNPEAMVYMQAAGKNSNEVGAELLINSPYGSFSLSSPLEGAFNQTNLLLVVAAALEMGCSISQLQSIVPQLSPPAGRMESVHSDLDDIKVIIDYAHTPDALENVLKTLRDASPAHLVCVFGCGGDRDTGKRPEMARVAELHADVVVVTADNPRSEPLPSIFENIRSGFTSSANVSYIDDRKEAISVAVRTALPGTTVLIAGKGHETSQQIGAKFIEFRDQLVAKESLRERRASDVH